MKSTLKYQKPMNKKLRHSSKSHHFRPKKKILLVCGSLNQTRIMHAIGGQLKNSYELKYSTFYIDGFWSFLNRTTLINRTIAGGTFKEQSSQYLRDHRLPVDEGGYEDNYDLVLIPQDVFLAKRPRGVPRVLIQEGMTDPTHFWFYFTRLLRLPLWFSSTSGTGLSRAYEFFCVASEGYKSHFAGLGISTDKLYVTGIPTFDDCKKIKPAPEYLGYSLVATSDSRETGKWYDFRHQYLRKLRKQINNQKIIFKLHPNEKYEKAKKEIISIFPEAIVVQQGSIDPLIAACSELYCQYSSVAFIGKALGKKVYSYYSGHYLDERLPWQNNGSSALLIANHIRDYLSVGELKE